MRIVAYDGYTFSVGGYSGGLSDDQNIGNFTLNPSTLPRRATGSLLTGSNIGPRSITVEFIYDGTGSLTPENAFQQLMGILDPTNENARTLTAQLNDGTTVSCEAIVLTPNAAFDAEVNVLPVTFFTVDPYWRTTTDSTTSVTISQASGIAVANGGTTRAYPTIDVAYTVQRTTDAASLGWKYRRQVVITNNTDEDWRNQPITVDLGDTAAWVTASKAQADGDDVRVRYQGQEIYRTLTNFNTKRTFCHFVVSIKSGDSRTYDVIYGNPSAGTARTMSTRSGSLATYIAYDLGGDSGTATSGTTSTLTDTGKSWTTNRWKNGFIGLVSGTGSIRWRRIYSNSATTITFNRILATAPDATTKYVIHMSGVFIDGGRVTARTANSITDDQHTTKWGAAASTGMGQLEGATVTFVGGSLANPATMTVASNTGDTLTFTSSFSVQPAVGDSFQIERLGTWNYKVNTAITSTADTEHRGLYRISRYNTPPATVWPGQLTPGGWGPDTYLANADDYRQLRPFEASGGGYWPLLRASRRIRQNAKYKDEGVGDGMSIYTPMRLQGIYSDRKEKNINGVGMIVTAIKESGGEDWVDVATSTTTRASLTIVSETYIDLDAYNNPTRLGIFVLPADGVQIESTIEDSGTVTARTSSTVTDTAESWVTNQWTLGTITFPNTSTADPKTMTIASNTANVLTLQSAFDTNPTVGDAYELSRDVANTDEVEVRTNDVMILTLDLTSFGDLSSSIYSIGSEVAVYDLNAKIRIGGGSEGYEVPPYDEIRIGGSGHYLYLKSTEYLRIRCDPATNEPFAAVYLTADDSLVYRAGHAVRVYRHEEDIDGTDVALVSREFMPIPTQTDYMTNGSFDTNTTGWTLTQTAGTATWSRDAATFYDAAGSLKVALNNNSTGRALSSSFTTVVGERYSLAFAWRPDDATVDEIQYLGVRAYAIDATTSTATPIGRYFSTIYGGYHAQPGIADTWILDGEEFTATDTSYRIAIDVHNQLGSASNVWIDKVQLIGAPILYVEESNMGTLAIDVALRAGYWG